MIRFADAETNSCRRPVDGAPGPDMLICGEDTFAGSSYCRTCRARLYYRPSQREINALDYAAGKPLKARGA